MNFSADKWTRLRWDFNFECIPPAFPLRNSSASNFDLPIPRLTAGFLQNNSSFCAVANCEESTLTPGVLGGLEPASCGLALSASDDTAG